MARFSIQRPISAAVLSLTILIASVLSLFIIRNTQRSQIAPLIVEVEFNYQDADVESSVDELTSILPLETVGAGFSAGNEQPELLMVISVFSPESLYDDDSLSGNDSIRLNQVRASIARSSLLAGNVRQPDAHFLVYRAPGAGAVETAKAVSALLEELQESLPPELEYEVTWNTAKLVELAIRESGLALRDAMILVPLVGFVLLGSIRSALIPLLTAPVPLAAMLVAFAALEFPVSALTMLAPALAVGIVVGDAIVIVEAVERNLAQGLSLAEATKRAMRAVTWPVVAIALAFSAGFFSVALLGGIAGLMHRRIALILSISVLVCAVVALNLTPALCKMLLRPRGEIRNVVWHLDAMKGNLRRMAIAAAVLVALYAGAGVVKILPAGVAALIDGGFGQKYERPIMIDVVGRV